MALSKLDQDSPFQVNKVIVALADAERASQFREPGDPEMLVVDEVDNSLCNAEDPSIQYGTVVTLTGDSFVDQFLHWKRRQAAVGSTLTQSTVPKRIKNAVKLYRIL